ncbi:hypothetical protein AVEN_266119-1 [Araneus ventricosus]|uniref:Uncharacterized protein n=1 Tax=Araneus ventricosus TaxID=182803 RepID=A0A4Y2M4S9_ARAVE|nr:hypothetical protein AVEN_266119-1 [Araneus ventricosus]
MNKSSPPTSFCTCLRSISHKQDGRHFLNAKYPARWIGRGRSVTLSPRSLDLNPLDFFFWGHMKYLVFETPVDSVEDLVTRIILAADKVNTPPGNLDRVRQ